MASVINRDTGRVRVHRTGARRPQKRRIERERCRKERDLGEADADHGFRISAAAKHCQAVIIRTRVQPSAGPARLQRIIQ